MSFTWSRKNSGSRKWSSNRQARPAATSIKTKQGFWRPRRDLNPCCRRERRVYGGFPSQRKTEVSSETPVFSMISSPTVIGQTGHSGTGETRQSVHKLFTGEERHT